MKKIIEQKNGKYRSLGLAKTEDEANRIVTNLKKQLPNSKIYFI